jgi:hypothetical protein
MAVIEPPMVARAAGYFASVQFLQTLETGQLPFTHRSMQHVVPQQ